MKRLSEDIPNKIRNALGIVPGMNFREEDGLDYIEIVVEPYDMAISYHGRYYYRTGSVKSELTGAELNAFLLKKAGRTWDAAGVPGLSVADLKTDAGARSVAAECDRRSDRRCDRSAVPVDTGHADRRRHDQAGRTRRQSGPASCHGRQEAQPVEGSRAHRACRLRPSGILAGPWASS